MVCDRSMGWPTHHSDFSHSLALQRTALRARKIVAILKGRIGPSALPIYECAAAEASSVGPHSACTFRTTGCLVVYYNPLTGGK